MIVGRKYSTVKKLVDDIEILKLYRAKVAALDLKDLREFVMQSQNDQILERFGYHSMKPESDYLNKIIEEIDNTIGNLMMELEVTPDPKFVSPGISTTE